MKIKNFHNSPPFPFCVICQVKIKTQATGKKIPAKLLLRDEAVVEIKSNI